MKSHEAKKKKNKVPSCFAAHKCEWQVWDRHNIMNNVECWISIYIGYWENMLGFQWLYDKPFLETQLM